MSDRALKALSLEDVRTLRASFDARLSALDPGVLAASTAGEILREVTAMKRRLEAAELALAKRVADTGVVRTRGDARGTKWTGRQLGVSVGAAGDMLDLADRLEGLPATQGALEAGRISLDQAAEIVRTATVEPGSEAELLAAAPRESLAELRRRAQRVRAAAEDDDVRHRRLHAERHLRTWTAPDGAGRGAWSLPPELHAEVLAVLAPWREKVFCEARRAGRREAPECYDADALVEVARDARAWQRRRPRRSTATSTSSEAVDPDADGGRADGTTGRPGTDGRPGGSSGLSAGAGDAGAHGSDDLERPSIGGDIRMVVRVDHTALMRGHTEPGETCEITGVGPVPVAAVREWLDLDPFIAVVITDATDIRGVSHPGRKATSLMRSALDWTNQGCSVLGCPNTANLQIDHRVDWATTGHTRFDELDWLCAGHHRQKTHDGFQLEPGQGTRRFLSPDEQRQRGLPPPRVHAPVRRGDPPRAGPSPSPGDGSASSQPPNSRRRQPAGRGPDHNPRRGRDPAQLPLSLPAA